MWSKPAKNDENIPMKSARRHAAPSILSIDISVEGDIVSEGEMHVTGAVKGDVVARKLTIGEGGSITGTIEADTVVIAGMLTGRVTATTVIFSPTARVAADVTYVSLTVDPGAKFEGYSRRVETIDLTRSEAHATEPRRLQAQQPQDATAA